MMFRPAVLAALLASGATVFALEGPLSSGATFPDLTGKSLAGQDRTLSMRDGKPKVLVVTFTREAAKPAQAWLDACRADETAASNPPKVACYDIRMAEGMPRLVRGFVEGRMRKGVQETQRDNVILIYKDNEAWRDRLMVMRDFENEPFLVLVDRQGRVQSLLRGAFDATALKSEQAKLAAN